MKVLHLPSSVGGNAWNLSQAERKLGIDSKVLNIGDNSFGFKCDIKVDWRKNKFTYPFKAIKFYKKELKNYDILHFNFGKTIFDYRNSFLNMIDLPFIKKSGVKIVFTYQGTDARQAKYCMDNYDITFYKNYSKDKLKEEYKMDKMKIKRIKKVNKYADIIYTTNPDLLNVLPKRALFRPYTKIKLEEYKPIYSNYNKKKIIIAHAPTNRLIKGTDLIIDKINQMIADGAPIKLLLIEKMSNEKTLEKLKTADLVVDQLYAGWYGGLAVEAMAFGKPVIAYIRETDLKNIPNEMAKDLPIINANSSNLIEVITDLLNDREKLSNIAKKSRKYVEKWHDSKKNAYAIIEKYKEILK